MTTPFDNLQGTGSDHSLEGVLERSNLTRSQYLIWAGQELTPAVPLYNMALAFTIHGAVDAELFDRAFGCLVQECDVLRTVCVASDGVPRQHVVAGMPAAVCHVDFSTAAVPHATARAWAAQRCTARLDPAVALYDTALLRLAADRWVWYFNQHHLVTDAWSTGVLYRRMAALYTAEATGQSPGPPPPPYQEYIAWERAQRGSPAQHQALAHWRQKPTVAEALRFYGRPATRSTATTRVTRVLGPQRSDAIRQLTQRPAWRALTADLARYNVFATAIAAWLHRLSAAEAVAISSPAHNRPSARFKDMAGLFIELFPLHVAIDAGETFDSLGRRVAAESLSFLRHARSGASDPSASRSVNVVLNYITASFAPFHGYGVESEWLHPGCGDANHAVRIQVHDFDDTDAFVLHADFNSACFDAVQRDAAMDQLMGMLDALLADSTQPIGHVALADSTHAAWWAQQFVAPLDTGQPPDVVERFEQTVDRQPTAAAVRCGQRSWTYRELDARANGVAAALAARRIGPGQRVGILARRSFDLVAAAWGVLKAGAAYVPLTPDQPAERLRWMVGHADVATVLAEDDLAERVGASASVLPMNDPAAAPVGPRPPRSANGADLAYVAYTSGSTGEPKGVAIARRSLANYVSWASEAYGHGGPLCMPLFTSFGFDLTVTTLFVPVVSGGCIVVYPEGAGSADLAILQVLEDNAVDTIKLTPSHLSLVHDVDLSSSRIRCVIVGGEAFTTARARHVHDALGGRAAIYNEYGPTEATVGCMIHRYDPVADRGEAVPIGRPIANSAVYVVDDGGHLVPPGIDGELLIGGAGLAVGYWGRHELTAERFAAHPVAGGARLYRTGDRARCTADGTLVFLGRRDEQVKIHGVRIELGEIEAAVAAHPHVTTCAVVAIHQETAARREPPQHCTRCGLPSTHPDAQLDDAGLCALCHQFETYRDAAMAYFKTPGELAALFEDNRRHGGAVDALVLLSGGKDSTYVLYRLVEMGLSVVAFSMDNGYISEGAKANVRRVCGELGVELVWGRTPSMNEVFADSLRRHSNVCNGCFKVIYTLSANLARERGIRIVVTGLSRGQIFETRLMDLFKARIFDADEIDHLIGEARKAYHRMDDAVSRNMDVALFRSDETFDAIRFVDFYRYCDDGLDDILGFLGSQAPWIRPADTGRSTNCLINAAGIYVHTRERGYHNYALPYSWDVRLGHKQRDAAMAELDDDLDVLTVQRMLREVGYDPLASTDGQRLAAYVVAEAGFDESALRASVARRLPAYMVPTHIITVPAIPLTPNGKLDRAALPVPAALRGSDTAYQAPRTDMERLLSRLWADVLGVERVGVHDDFIALGGDSILGIQMIAQARRRGLRFTPSLLFDHGTIAELAGVVRCEAEGGAADRDTTGVVPLTPVQVRFLSSPTGNPAHHNHVLDLVVPGPPDPAALAVALQACCQHHDALRARFTRTADGWQQNIPEEAPPVPVVMRPDTAGAAIPPTTDLDLEQGRLVHATVFAGDDDGTHTLRLVVHHLAIDGVSWPILLEDLGTALQQARGGVALVLPEPTTSLKSWATALQDHARRASAEAVALDSAAPAAPLPRDGSTGRNDVASQDTVQLTVDRATTRRLVTDLAPAYRMGVDDILLTVLSQAVLAWTAGDAWCVDVEGHGRHPLREDHDVSRTIGWFTTIAPMRLAVAADAPARVALSTIKAQLQGAARRGFDYCLQRYLGPDTVRQRLAAAPAAEVQFNYLGQWRPGTSTWARPRGALRLSACPHRERSHLLEVDAVVFADQLQIDWTFSTARHRRSTIEGLVGRFSDRLQALIDAALSDGQGHTTPADFPLAGLDDRRLGQLSRLLDTVDDEPGATP